MHGVIPLSVHHSRRLGSDISVTAQPDLNYLHITEKTSGLK